MRKYQLITNVLKSENMSSKIFKKLVKTAYKPILSKTAIEQKEELLSKYFGTVWMNKDEKWPCLDDDEKIPALCVLQLNISTLPDEYKNKLGGSGLLQFFYQYNGGRYGSDSLVRKITNFENGSFVSQPLESGIDKYKEKTIVEWKATKDYPHQQDVYEGDDVEKILDGEEYDLDELIELTEEYDCIQGDKLGGWPFYSQGVENLGTFIFQIDAGCFYDGKKFPANAKELFAGDGTGHIFIEEFEWLEDSEKLDKEENIYVFNWACG